MKTKNVRFLLLATLLIGVIAEGATAKTAVPKVLILNAYHQGEDWSDNQLNGILPALKKVSPFLVPSIEYLDTKRFPGEGHLEFFKDYLKNKYQGRDFDLIIALDNSALHLMVQYSDELFPDTPIIFAGVNGYHTGMLKGRDKITGVAEVYDIIGTLELILKLHPETKTIFAVHDYTSSGLAVRREMDEECRYTFVSDRIKLILGYDPAEIMNKTLFDLMPREEAIRRMRSKSG